MKSPVTKLAAAAVIIIAVIVFNSQFSTSGVAWGALAEKIESVQSVIYHLNVDTKMQNVPQGQVPKTTGISYYSSKYGTRSETFMNKQLSMITYLNPPENLYVTVLPESKRFMNITNKSCHKSTKSLVVIKLTELKSRE